LGLGIGGLAILTIAVGICAQGADLATGVVLVATAKSKDPDFARSAVVLIHYDSESAMGLMLNKPAGVPISEVLPGAKGKPAVIFGGGPVSIGVRGLVRTESPPFFRVITNKAELLRRIASGEPSSTFRIYAGYTGWTTRQLQSEVARGLWKVLPADLGTLWQRAWHHRTELR
jgi:putative transcriptional regulator